ncbi:MAG TPA: hypothetical protein VK541_19370 [Pedobacter sp.]|uniref:hypothetical protein n=1 Tax=Pedobacter sp. TaxID=1411316 RepID=UPI002CACCBF5|nr:hypothetical protein [Pedobacter sp.]HMI04660.1 hypothetical protein [Pedobacter sp.]
MLSIGLHSQNYLIYTPLSQTVTTTSGVEVSATVQVNCYGGQSGSLLVTPTYCAFDDGLKSITYSNGNYLTPGYNTIMTFKFKATVTQNVTSVYKFSTNGSCFQNEAQMIKITVNYNYTAPPACNGGVPNSIYTACCSHYSDRFLAVWSNSNPNYELQYKKTSETNWTNQNTDIYYGDPFCTKWVNNLLPDTQYQWRVRGKCASGQYGIWSTVESAYTVPCVTTPLSNVSATPSGSSYIINFTPATSNSQIYYVMDYVNLTNNYPGSLTISNGDYFYYVLPPNSFKFKIRVVGGCNIPDSDWITVNPVLCPANNYPASLSFSATSICGSTPGHCCGYGQFSWTPVSGATSYQIEYMGVNLTNGAVPPVSGTFQTASTNTTQQTIYACNANQAGTWILKYRVKSKCPNGTWSDFSPWSANFAW